MPAPHIEHSSQRLPFGVLEEGKVYRLRVSAKRSKLHDAFVQIEKIYSEFRIVCRGPDFRKLTLAYPEVDFLDIAAPKRYTLDDLIARIQGCHPKSLETYVTVGGTLHRITGGMVRSSYGSSTVQKIPGGFGFVLDTEPV